MRNQTIELMKEHSQLFMGVQPNFKFILDTLASKFGTDKNALLKVMLTLRKIRLNEVFELLALYMGISVSYASEIFRKNLPTVSACLSELIFSVPKSTTLLNLPVAFRLNYHNVTHTLDCFEVQIQTPSNSMHRAITWSSYKHCPTLKYLISITPDVFCNYISRGYGGRNTDIGITNNCGLLQCILRDNDVLADRGFKSLEAILAARGVNLKRPPSVFKGRPMSKDDCATGRQVASVRIHVERYIGRLREFSLIAPHSTVPIKMIPLVDMCVVIACGLTNLGAPLIAGNEIM